MQNIDEIKNNLINGTPDKKETTLFILLHEDNKKEFFDEVVSCTKSIEDNIRHAAFMVLSAINNKNKIPIMESALNDKYWKIRATAALDLSKFKNEKAIPTLKSIILSNISDHSIHKRAIEALGKYKNEEFLNIFQQMLQHRRIMNRLKAVEAIQKIASEKALSILMEAIIKETEASVKSRIRNSIEGIKNTLSS